MMDKEKKKGRKLSFCPNTARLCDRIEKVSFDVKQYMYCRQVSIGVCLRRFVNDADKMGIVL